ncbi:MAG: hypothetical protein R3236_05335 [Phycisphaeraceae bacterium]|nr:hypothetical protein [Phycisphaeraceae bacterium]
MSEAEHPSRMVLAMILDNPGEQPHATRYRDPHLLKGIGYTDLIVYPTTGLSGLLGAETVEAGEMRRWVAQQIDSVRETVSSARAAGLGAWLTFDTPALARDLIGSAMTCINQQPVTLCPGSDELLEMSGQCLESLLGQVEGVEGVVLRLGDSDATKVPYLIGNDVYSPHCSRCSGIGRADRVARFIRFFHQLVVEKLGLRLIVRAWNVRPGGMHDSADVCSRVVQQLPDDDRLILSFKFTHTDFWRYQRWNPPSLNCGKRPIIYELQCQREFESKGAVPNYQPPLWTAGMGEVDGAKGLAAVASQVNLVGLWAWVRGGGWRGPYITTDSETWIDANVTAVAPLAADPTVSAEKLAGDWVHNALGITDPEAVDAIRQILIESPQAILETFYIGPYARQHHIPWYPAAHFIQDDQINAEAAWSIVQQIDEKRLDEIIAEKKSAEQRWSTGRKRLEKLEAGSDERKIRPLIKSLLYGESLVRTLRHLLSGLVAYRRHLRKPADRTLAQAARRSLAESQRCWVDHTQKSGSRETASPFDSEDLWAFTQTLIDQLAEGGS